MRYTRLESTKVVGVFPTGSVVTVLVLNTEIDQLVPVSSNVCSESDKVDGVFYWDTTNILTPFTTPTGVMIIMESGSHRVFVKVLLGDDTTSDKLDEYPNKESFKAEVDLTDIDTKLDDIPNKVWEKTLP